MARRVDKIKVETGHLHMGKSEQEGQSVGPIHKRKEEMADGRRYLIYYTFGSENPEPLPFTPAIDAKSEDEGTDV